jgi:hypothetical protein
MVQEAKSPVKKSRQAEGFNSGVKEFRQLHENKLPPLLTSTPTLNALHIAE